MSQFLTQTTQGALFHFNGDSKKDMVPGCRFATAELHGHRPSMEDAHVLKTGLNYAFQTESGETEIIHTLIGVFDGHLGSQASIFCREHLCDTFDEVYKEMFSPDAPYPSIRSMISATFQRLDQKFFEIQKSIIDSDDTQDSGSTANVAFLSSSHIHMANCGDSRGVLSRGGRPIIETRDHDVHNEEEKARIIRAGGFLAPWEMGRVAGIHGSYLEPTRGFGDFGFKIKPTGLLNENYCRLDEEQKGIWKYGKYGCPTADLVTREPDIYTIKREEDDQFLLIASDGIWKKVSSEEACTFLIEQFKNEESLVKIADHLIQLSFKKNGRDNITVVLVSFPGAPCKYRFDGASTQPDPHLED